MLHRVYPKLQPLQFANYNVLSHNLDFYFLIAQL